MKRICIILGFIFAILSVILSVTPLFKLAIIPIILAVLFGIGLLYITKKSKTKTKVIQYIFLLVIISLVLTLYKSIFIEAEVGNTEELEQREEDSKEDSIELLEGLEIDD